MQVVLEGKIITPIITKWPSFYLKGCKAQIKKGTIRRRYYSKIKVKVPMFPYSLICYLGTLQVRFTCTSKQKAVKTLKQLIRIEQIGRFHAEGLGKIKWLQAQFFQNPPVNYYNKRKMKIRKGLPQHLPKRALKLIRYGLLHDFVHNNLHRSKIYIEPEITDQKYLELLKDHHQNNFKDSIVQEFQYYDRLAASITRKVRSPRQDRYNWKATKKIDFQQLANQISEVSNNVWKLYQFIYQSKDLSILNESLRFGHTSLRRHLLIIANLIVQNYLPENTKKEK